MIWAYRYLSPQPIPTLRSFLTISTSVKSLSLCNFFKASSMAKPIALCFYVLFIASLLHSTSSQTSPAPGPAPEADSPPPISSPPSPPPVTSSSPPSPPPSSTDLPPSPSPSPKSSSEPTPSPEQSPSDHVKNGEVKVNNDEAKGGGGGGGMSAGKKAVIALGVIAAACVVGVGIVVYKKRQANMERSSYSYAARREML